MIKEQLFFDPETALMYLEDVGQMPDEDIDLFEATLALAVHDHPGKSVDQYRQHLKKLIEQLQTKFNEFVQNEQLPDNVDTQILSLRHVMCRQNGYAGDMLHYDDLQNADIMRVIDRRLGLPISLGIIALATARACGWEVYGLNFPGHFLIRIDGARGVRHILDPFNLFEEVSAAEMRKLLKDNLGEDAELSSSYYDAASNRDILIRQQNNIKFRLIEAEDYQGALFRVELMKRFAPNEPKLLFDEGVILARLEHHAAAIKALREYMDHSKDGRDRMQVLGLINELSAMLN